MDASTTGYFSFWLMVVLYFIPAILVLLTKMDRRWSKTVGFFLCIFFSWFGYLAYRMSYKPNQ
ncbi:MAG: hypothetical protein HWE27_03775 [Gammaproteobacteria bacterium]|nr:hypothetical protein [Gammaproteobacteria bacterium]